MKIKIIGTVYEILPKKSGTGRNGFWESQDVVIKTGESNYGEEFVVVSLFGDKIMMNPKVGEFVKIECNLKAKNSGDRWFNSINLWRWEETAPGLSDNEVTVLERSNAEELKLDDWDKLPDYEQLSSSKQQSENFNDNDLPF